MKTAVIVQARTGSTRLPRKVLKPLPGRKTVLEEVLRRCAAIPDIDSVVCATSDLPADDEIAITASSTGATVVRGSSDDVLSRYLKSAEAVNADVILRVTSDCPLIDPDVCSRTLRLVTETNADFACNNEIRTFPHGLDCEAFTIGALRKADRAGTTPYDREHVTPWLRRTSNISRINLAADDDSAASYRWTLDYPEDYEFFYELFKLLPPPPAIPSWKNIVEIQKSHPEISAINAEIADPLVQAASGGGAEG